MAINPLHRPPNPLVAFLFMMVVLSPFCEATFVLYSGQTLAAGQSLRNENYQFIMQLDCNLVLYESGRPVWASQTGGLSRRCYCPMQSDGNLVVYTPAGTPIWASQTGGRQGNYVLVLQPDRNVVVYGGAMWATGTHVQNEYLSINVVNAEHDSRGVKFITSLKANTTDETILVTDGISTLV